LDFERYCCNALSNHVHVVYIIRISYNRRSIRSKQFCGVSKRYNKIVLKLKIYIKYTASIIFRTIFNVPRFENSTNRCVGSFRFLTSTQQFSSWERFLSIIVYDHEQYEYVSRDNNYVTAQKSKKQNVIGANIMTHSARCCITEW